MKLNHSEAIQKNQYTCPMQSLKENPSVEKVVAEEGFNEDELLQKISSLNKQSEHPLAEAVAKYANARLSDGPEKKLSFSECKRF